MEDRKERKKFDVDTVVQLTKRLELDIKFCNHRIVKRKPSFGDAALPVGFWGTIIGIDTYNKGDEPWYLVGIHGCCELWLKADEIELYP